MEREIQPIYLFADSQLLFWKPDIAPFLERIRHREMSKSPAAAYIGASNQDAPEFYSLFEAAMEGIGVYDCCPIQSSFCDSDASFLADADIILLAGGDVESGWKVIESTRMADVVRRRYVDGATLIGISAGAVQLGLFGWIKIADDSHRLINTLKLVPYIVDAHDEAREWAGLAAVIRMLEGSARGLGIPRGGGIIYHADQSIEAIRRPVYEFTMMGGTFKRILLLPPRTAGVA